ncbi:MAG: hypothetical protein ACK45H_01135, partial [Bacteroidota bacterium]
MILKSNSFKLLSFAALLLVVYSCKVISDAKEFPDDQIEQILATMSIEEKVGQTCQVTLDVVA